jgi:hypothetical protein
MSEWPRELAKVVNLLERCWPAVVEVAQKLLRDNEVRHGDVCRALGLSDAGGPGSFELGAHSVRAGTRRLHRDASRAIEGTRPRDR